MFACRRIKHKNTMQLGAALRMQLGRLLSATLGASLSASLTKSLTKETLHKSTDMHLKR
jgi:hypothetical protein